jgi:uncharacterized protein (TIGR02266 family)
VEAARTILVVDDTPLFRELGALFLARTGRVVTANNGFEALELAGRECPSVIVADLDMPHMGGDDLCRRLKQIPELRDTAVILLTAGDRGEDRARAIRAGASDVLAKPLSRVALIQAVNRFLRGGRGRGLTRAELEAPVQIVHRSESRWGQARNLSRGGMFVEAELPMPLYTEVELEFRLREDAAPLLPTAQVVWRREPGPGRRPGVGLQFLALDGSSARAIDAYVYEHGRAGADAGADR